MDGRDEVKGVVLPVTVAFMAACVVFSAVALVEMLDNSWNGSEVPLLATLVALEGFASWRLRRSPLLRDRSPLPFRIAELVLIFTVTSVVDALANGIDPFVNGMPNLNRESLLIFGALMVIWLQARDVARALDAIERPDPLPVYAAPRRFLTGRFVGGGVLLLIVAALTQQNVARLLHLPEPSSSGPVLNVLLYFLLGIATLTYVHYATLRYRWRLQEVRIGPALASRWVRYTLAFLGLVLLAALFFPTRDSIGLASAVHAVWNGVVTWLWDPLLRLLMRLGIRQRPNTVPPHSFPFHFRPPHQAPPSKPAKPSHPPSWLPYLQTLFFWVVLLTCAVYLLRLTLKNRPHGAPQIRLPSPLARLRALLRNAWSSLRLLLHGYARMVVERWPERLSVRPHGAVAAPRLARFARVGSLSPREQVQYYYRSTVRRAGRQGLQRRPSQTPKEFQEAVAASVPQTEGDMGILTGRFEEARYSRHEVGEPQAGEARTSWQRLRAALRLGAR